MTTDEPHEMDAAVPLDIRALFERAEKLRREMADEFISAYTAKRRARMARMMEDE